MQAFPSAVASTSLVTLILCAKVSADDPAAVFPPPDEPTAVARCRMDARYRIEVDVVYHHATASAFSEPVEVLEHECWVQIRPSPDSGRSYRFMCRPKTASQIYGVVLREDPGTKKAKPRSLSGSLIIPRGDIDVRCTEERSATSQRIR